MPALAIIPSVTHRKNLKVWDLPTGINVDDYYQVGDGNDDAASIRRAINFALANGISKVSFTNKTYFIRSAVAETSYPNNPWTSIPIKCTDWVERLEIAGNGAVLFNPGRVTNADHATIMLVRASIRNLKIHGLHFKRDLLLYNATDNYLGEARRASVAGLIVADVPTKSDISVLWVDKCIFEDCHRALEISSGWFPSSSFLSNGQLKSSVVSNCQFLYPRGANIRKARNAQGAELDYWGGSQTLLTNNWVKDLWIHGCLLDGATSGTWEGNGMSPPLDGLTIGGSINTRVTGCELKHYDFEGLYFQKPERLLDSDGAFSVPAIGQNFNMPMYRWGSILGIQVGSKMRMTGVNYTMPFTHEFEVVSVNTTQPLADPSPTLTLKVLSGSPVVVTQGQAVGMRPDMLDQPWTHQALDNRMTDVQVSKGGVLNRGYNAIEFIGSDNCTASGNIIGPCGGIAFRSVKSISILNNTISGYDLLVWDMDPLSVTSKTIAYNNLQILNGDAYGVDPLYRRAISVRSLGKSRIHHNTISHDTSKVRFGDGIDTFPQIIDLQIDNNSFSNLKRDVTNQGIGYNLFYTMKDNTFTNVQNVQTTFPLIFANDAAAAASGSPGPVPIGGIYMTSSGEIRNRLI